MSEPLTVRSAGGSATSAALAGLARHLLASNMRTLIALLLWWATVAVIATTTAFIAVNGNSLASWLRIFAPMTLYYSVWFVISLVIYRIVDTLHGNPARNLLAVLAHLLLFAIVAVSLPFIVHYENWPLWLYGARAPGFHALAAVIYLLNLVGSFLIRFYRLSVARDREARDARLRSSLLENQLNLAQMDALKMQINPHFMFNALNSIAALIQTDRNVEAYHATELLGGLLRRTLDQSGDRFLTLEQELDFLGRYIEVEKVRFGSRIVFQISVDAASRAREIPALILQPLIENSIKHAVNLSTRPVHIHLAAWEADDDLVIELTDDGPGLSQPPGDAEGLGLSNTEERLNLVYEGRASFRVTNVATGGVCARLELPAGRSTH